MLLHNFGKKLTIQKIYFLPSAILKLKVVYTHKMSVMNININSKD